MSSVTDNLSQIGGAGLSMAAAVTSLLTGSAPPALGLNLTSPTSAIASNGMTNLQAYLANQQSHPTLQPWQVESFRPSTRTIVEAVKLLNVQDVQWFLYQLDLEKNGGRRKERTQTPAAMPQPPTSPPSTATSPSASMTDSSSNTNGRRNPFDEVENSVAATPKTASSSSSSAAASAAAAQPVSNGTSTPASSSSAVPAHLSSPSPLLATLPADALQLPTSSPYILDILLDTILGLQFREEFAEIHAQKLKNEQKAKEDGMDEKLVHLLTPLPPVKPASLYLSSPLSEHAFQVLSALVEAVDIVGVSSLSKQAAIDYLKKSDIPYPISDKNEDGSWTIVPEFKKRVWLLEAYGAVLDVERISKEEEEVKEAMGGSKKKIKRSGSSVPAQEPGSLFDLSCLNLPPPPRSSDFIHPPFSYSDRNSQESYLKHTYLLLLEKRQLFLKLVAEVLTRVRNQRAQANYQLSLAKAQVEAKVSKILNDIKSFESALEKSSQHKQDSQSQQAMDMANAEKIERQALAVRREEEKVIREAVAVKGVRIVQQNHSTELERMNTAKQRYFTLRETGREVLQAVENARSQLQSVNQQFDKWALLLEARQKEQERLKEKKTHMKEYVASFESAVKQAKKSLKETMARVEKSRALAASKQVVEFEMSGRAVQLLFANGLSGVSNLFLKFFRCMSPAPDPNDPNPEVVWCPDPCCVTELCSPSATRSVSQVANPVWRTVRIDVWKLCEAEFDRYFKVEVWDCDASIKQVQGVVRTAIEQAKIDSEQKTKAALEELNSASPPLNPDGTPIAPLGVNQPPAVPTSVTLPSTSQIKYAYVGQSVCTLQQLIDAHRKRRAEQEASAAVSAPFTGVMTLPIINADRWAARNNIQTYTDSGQLIFSSFKIVEDEQAS